MNLELGSMLLAGAKSLGTLLLKEIKNKMQNNNLTVNAKEKINKERNEIIENYADIYEVKNGEMKLLSKNNKTPEFIGATDLENGFYEKQENTFKLNKNLTDKINEELNLSKNRIIEEEKEFINSQKNIGEEYVVDEIGDDEKYVFLTRKSTGKSFQEFIPDELYNELLSQEKPSNIILVFDGEKYNIK